MSVSAGKGEQTNGRVARIAPVRSQTTGQREASHDIAVKGTIAISRTFQTVVMCSWNLLSQCLSLDRTREIDPKPYKDAETSSHHALPSADCPVICRGQSHPAVYSHSIYLERIYPFLLAIHP